MTNARSRRPLPEGIRILPYSAEHRDGVLSCFRSNVPGSFEADEESAFVEHVEGEKGPYVVFIDRGRVVACGGYALRGDTADVCWGMVHADAQKQGLGEALLLYRLRAIARGPARFVRLETTQHTENFFRRYGFAVAEREANGYRPGLDRVEMRAEVRDLSTRLDSEQTARSGIDFSSDHET